MTRVAETAVVSGHTPGPWSHDYRHNRNGGYSQEVFDERGELIATAAWYPVKLDDIITTTNREANARLIAAAPDLLEAAERALAELEMFCAGTSLGEIGKLRAAIAKARGQ